MRWWPVRLLTEEGTARPGSRDQHRGRLPRRSCAKRLERERETPGPENPQTKLNSSSLALLVRPKAAKAFMEKPPIPFTHPISSMPPEDSDLKQIARDTKGRNLLTLHTPIPSQPMAPKAPKVSKDGRK